MTYHGTFSTVRNRATTVGAGRKQQRPVRDRELQVKSRLQATACDRRKLAEGEGFEPPIPFRAQRFSRPPPSTTRPSLRGLGSSDYTITPMREAREASWSGGTAPP